MKREEAEQSFANEQEKQHYIREVWYKVNKKEGIKKWVRRSCFIGAIVAMIVIRIVFKDSLPKWLLEGKGTYGHRYSLLEIICISISLLVGDGLSRLIINLMKLDE